MMIKKKAKENVGWKNFLFCWKKINDFWYNKFVRKTRQEDFKRNWHLWNMTLHFFSLWICVLFPFLRRIHPAKIWNKKQKNVSLSMWTSFSASSLSLAKIPFVKETVPFSRKTQEKPNFELECKRAHWLQLGSGNSKCPCFSFWQHFSGGKLFFLCFEFWQQFSGIFWRKHRICQSLLFTDQKSLNGSFFSATFSIV